MINLNGLTTEEYDLVFNTDWNKGNDSEMTSLQRAMIHDLFLKYLRYKPKEIEKQTDTEPIGFIEIN
jgi:hypothetical protein